MTDPILDDLMGRCRDLAMSAARHDELMTPILFTLRPDGTVTTTIIDVPSVHPATVAKLMIFSEQATHAALAFEGWGVDVDPAADPITARLLNQHVVRPRDLPPDKRYDSLWVLGETPSGERASWRWRIDPAVAGGTRTFRDHPLPWDEIAEEKNIFRPLYADLAWIMVKAREGAGRP